MGSEAATTLSFEESCWERVECKQSVGIFRHSVCFVCEYWQQNLLFPTGWRRRGGCRLAGLGTCWHSHDMEHVEVALPDSHLRCCHGHSVADFTPRDTPLLPANCIVHHLFAEKAEEMVNKSHTSAVCVTHD